MRIALASLLLLAACGAHPPALFAPSSTPPPAAPVTRIAAACPTQPFALPTPTAHAVVPPATGADVMRIDTIGGGTTLVTIDRGSDDGVRVGDRGWLIDDDGRPIHASEFVVSTVRGRESRAAIRLLGVGEVRRHSRAQLVPTN